MKTLTRDEILGADDLKTESVQVPEWGGVVIVRELTGSERDAWEASVVKTNGANITVDHTHMRGRLAAMAIVDDKGERMFTDKDIAALGKKSAGALDRVVNVALRLSKIGEEQLESLGKASGKTRRGASAST